MTKATLRSIVIWNLWKESRYNQIEIETKNKKAGIKISKNWDCNQSLERKRQNELNIWERFIVAANK